MSSWPGGGQIPELLIGFRIAHLVPTGTATYRSSPLRPGAAVARPALAGRRLEDALDAKIRQRIDAFGGPQPHAAAVAAIAAVRAAERHEFLAPEAGAAAAAVAGLHPDGGLIDEFHGLTTAP